MDTASLQFLMQRFIKMVDLPDLEADLPEQFTKHWDNQGKSGTVQIFTTRFGEQPAELTLSFFFNADEVIQTGIQIKFRDEQIVNEVLKGDELGFKKTKRVDPVAFLKQRYGNAPKGPADSTSYTLAVDEDSEPELFRAVQQLTGLNEQELRDIWGDLILGNDTRPGIDKVSPIIRVWLKKVRDRLDRGFLRGARLLQPRAEEIQHFPAFGRTITVVAKRLSGHRIREKIDHSSPEWWGGMFFGISRGTLVRIAHDRKDLLLAIKSLDNVFEFPVEEIYVDSRHIYCAIFIGEEAIVWRTQEHVFPAPLGAPTSASPAPPRKPGTLKKLVSRFQGQSATSASSPADSTQSSNPSQAPTVNRFILARSEQGYIENLRTRSADLNDHRKEYMKLLYDSDPSRFQQKPQELRLEMAEAVTQALGNNPAAIQRETALLDAHITIFYSEQPAEPASR